MNSNRKIFFTQLAEVDLTDKKKVIISEMNNEKIVIGQQVRFEDPQSPTGEVKVFLKNAIIMSYSQFDELRNALNNL